MQLPLKRFVEDLERNSRKAYQLWQQRDPHEHDNAPVIEALIDIVHHLHGVGSLFGYDDVSDLAGRIQYLLMKVIEEHIRLNPEEEREIGLLIEELREYADKIGSEMMGSAPSCALPLPQESSTTDHPSGDAPRPKVLVIDDSALMCQKIREGLECEGIQVRLSTDGRSGVEAAVKEPPHLILLDIRMPGLDGFQTLQLLRTQPTLGDVPVILITSINRISVDQVQMALQHGVSDYIAKPFKMDLLVAKVHALTGIPHP
jgi:CheY-like chemotaxis protein